MAKISIMREDNMVVVDGRGLIVDCSRIDPNIRAVEWEDGYGGQVEFVRDRGMPVRLNGMLAAVADFAEFQPLVDAWRAKAEAVDRPPPLTLEQAKAARVEMLRAKCSLEIAGGFKSSALGTEHRYAGDLVSQHDLTASVLAAAIAGLVPAYAGIAGTTPFWCSADGKTWRLVEHTAPQITRVGLDAQAWVVAAQRKLAGLRTQIDAAATVDAVDAIDW